MNYEFPKDFWWGAAISATQVEGAGFEEGRTASIFDEFFKNDPWRFEDMNHGPEKAVDFYHRYKEDIKKAKKIGLKTLRFTISWSRILPQGIKGKVNEKAVEFYNNVIDTLIENDIEPFVGLMCFDPPAYLKDGEKLWDRREVVEEYAFYGKTCFENFGKKVKKWFTAVEGAVHIELGYQGYYHPPLVVDLKRFFQASFNFLLGSARCIEEYKKLGLDGVIGTINAVYPVIPMGTHKRDLDAAKCADLIKNRFYLDTFIKGKIPEELFEFWEKYDLTPQFKDEDLKVIKNNTIEILGVNYYDPVRVRAPRFIKNPDAPLSLEHFFEQVHTNGGRKAFGREIYERGLYEALIKIRDEYNNIQCYISENGVRMKEEGRFRNAEGVIEDDYRIDFIKNHLIMLLKARNEGCNVNGYHPWTLMDNWSWIRSMTYRYGLIEVNKDTMERTIKKSGYWYSDTIKNNGFN
ncbi:glycoside hydrolase family 1 protein [Clostridium oceanicum]|uniref:6-phospho-beta-glucosidase GmuD n=1 Tax=Clostridium oceanicum TaxID=1543 RepID=A0ABN1JCH5_9CLOT